MSLSRVDFPAVPPDKAYFPFIGNGRCRLLEERLSFNAVCKVVDMKHGSIAGASDLAATRAPNKLLSAGWGPPLRAVRVKTALRPQTEGCCLPVSRPIDRERAKFAPEPMQEFDHGA